MEVVRIEAQLDAALSSDNACSVLWLVPEADPRELGRGMAGVTAVAAMAAWGFVGLWDRSKLLEARAADVSRLSRGSAEYTTDNTRMKAEMLALPFEEGGWFWTQFGAKMRPHQICGALIPASAETGGWRYAGLQLVLSAAARQARPGVSHEYTLLALEQAFLAEVVAAGGVVVTRLRAELLRPGVALTSKRDLIDRVSVGIADAPVIDPLLVERSRLLSGMILRR
jgi:hypothetical protein